jgi:hypothetical protein
MLAVQALQVKVTQEEQQLLVTVPMLIQAVVEQVEQVETLATQDLATHLLVAVELV